jgi:hypothetical protein
MLTRKYIKLGFQEAELNGLQVLKFRDRIIFILGENVHIRHGFVRQLCDTYINSFMSPARLVPVQT